MAFSVQECTLSRSSNTGLDRIRAHTENSRPFRKRFLAGGVGAGCVVVPPAAGSKNGSRYPQEVAATRRWLREATQLLRKTK